MSGEANTTQIRMPTECPIFDCHVHVWDGIDGLINGWTTEDVGYGRVRFRRQAGIDVEQPLFPDYVPDGTGTADEIELRFVPPSFVEMKDLGRVLVEHMDWAGVSRALLLNGHPYHAKDNHAYIAEMLRRYPGRFVGTAQIDPLDADAVEQLDAAADLGLSGLDLGLCTEEGFLMPGLRPELRVSDPELAPFWRKAANLRMFVVVYFGELGTAGYQLAGCRMLAEEYGLSVILNHFGSVAIGHTDLAHHTENLKRRGLFAQWLEGVRLCRLPNVYYSQDGHSVLFRRNDRYPFPAYQQWFELMRIFKEEAGTGKLLNGSDYPCILRDSTYHDTFNCIHDVPCFTAEDRRNVLGANAERLLS